MSPVPGVLLLLSLAAPGRASAGEPAAPPSVEEMQEKAAKTDRRKDKKKAAVGTPLSLSLSLAFDNITWDDIAVSTAVPSELTARLLRRGFYRLEIIQLVLMAEESGSRLSALTAKREKKRSMREIARSLQLDYDRIYERSLLKAEEVERRIREVSMVSTGGKGGR